MNYHREFDIAWRGLKDGKNTFQYDVNDQVLKDLGYEEQDFSHLESEVELILEKENNFFLLHFRIEGQANVICDRCGDPFTLNLWDEYDLVVKLTDTTEKADELNEAEEGGEVVYIARSETVINVFKWIYEFIMLSFPIQRIHPDHADGTSGCNPEALKLLHQMNAEAENEKTESIWKELEKIKKNISKN